MDRSARTLSAIAVALLTGAVAAFPALAQEPDPTPLERPAVVNLCVQVITREPWLAADLIAAAIEGRAEAADDPSLVLLQVGEDGTCGDAAEPATDEPTPSPTEPEAATDDGARFLIFVVAATRLGSIDFDIDTPFGARVAANELEDLQQDLGELETAPCFEDVAARVIEVVDLMRRAAQASADEDLLALVEITGELEDVAGILGDLEGSLDEAGEACGLPG